MLLEIMHIRVSLQEPQQLIDDTLQMHLLGSNQRKPLLQVKTHLIAKSRDRTRAGAVMFLHPMVEDMTEQIKVLFHVFGVFFTCRINGVAGRRLRLI